MNTLSKIEFNEKLWMRKIKESKYRDDLKL